MSEKTVATVKLDSPITRGDATITEIVLRKPQSGALRGTRLQAVMEMDVASMMTVIPRISTPTLTPQEMADLDPADRPRCRSRWSFFCCRSRRLPICRQPDGR
ncbi:phage tail assembly protein [Klebsiella pneumoniae]|nr:phage tail assembly protein [Klebsiella pneumoniae]